ncbi:MAG: hypothetical protein HYU63_09200, partial [Armatimonadetes bacterium]|nr:hypothetical protein [Armatimonadota bacterium]
MNKDFDINNNLGRKFPLSYQWFSSGDKEENKILRETLEKLPDNISSILLSFVDKHKNTKHWDELKTPFFQFVQNFLKTNNFNFLDKISLTYPEFGEMKNQISNYPNSLKSGYYPQVHDTVTINPGGFKIKEDILTPKEPSIGKTLFSNTDIQEWVLGDSWARKHPSSLDSYAGLSINSSLTPKQISELQTNPEHPQEIDFKLQGETGIKYRSRTLDIYLKAKAGGAFRGENTDQGLDFARQYSQLPSRIFNLAGEIKNFVHNPNIDNIPSTISAINHTIQKISS